VNSFEQHSIEFYCELFLVSNDQDASELSLRVDCSYCFVFDERES
jgi:hypothetical protein